MQLQGCLGTGSYGKVLKLQIGNQHFAIKKIQLTFDIEDDSPQMNSMRNEAQISCELVYHPNIVRSYSYFRKHDFFYLIMEFVGYRSLQDLALPLINQKQIVNLIIQLSMGLKHLKHNKIIHRDIKPSNILISEKGILKIADFGVSKHLKQIKQTKSRVGTPFYTAPQIIQEKQYDYSVDVWSFGVVIYEVIHGTLPFQARSMHQLRQKIRFENPIIRRDIHSDLRLIIRSCLVKNSANRIHIQQILKIPLIKTQMLEEIESPAKYY